MPSTSSPAAMPRAVREQRQWELKYARLREFVEKHGRLPHQSEAMPEHDWKIGQWLDSQRAARRRGKMPPDRARRLEAIPGWSWGKQAASVATVRLEFEDAHRLLVEWIERTGEMPTATAEVQTPDGLFRLGAWCHRRKVDYRVGRLSREQCVLLDQTVAWEWARPRLPWMDTYRLLREWVAEHGHLPALHVEIVLPTALAAEDGAGPHRVWLGNWVRLQRQARGRERLGPTQVWLLNQIPGWVWPDTEAAARDLGDLFHPPAPTGRHLTAVPRL